MLLLLCAGEMMGCSKALSAGSEKKRQKFWLWFRQLFGARKAAARRKKGKQMYLETTDYNWYHLGEGEQSDARSALGKARVFC